MSPLATWVVLAVILGCLALVAVKAAHGLLRTRFDRHADQALAVGNDEDPR